MTIRPVHINTYTAIPGIWGAPGPGANHAPPANNAPVDGVPSPPGYTPAPLPDNGAPMPGFLRDHAARRAGGQPPTGPVAPGVAPSPTGGGFSAVRAAGHFFKGFAMQGVDMVKSAIANPIPTLAMAAAGAAACYFVSWAGLAMAVGFAALGAFKIFKGVMAYKADRAAGNGTKAEQDFEVIGRGSFEVALAVGPWLAQKWMARFKGGANVGTGGKAPKAPRAPRTPKAPKVAKVTTPKVPTGGSGPAVPKAPKVTAPKAPKVTVPKAPKVTVPKAPKVTVPKVKVATPAAIVETTAIPASKAGAAHVGMAPEPVVAKPITVKPAKVVKPIVKPKVVKVVTPKAPKVKVVTPATTVETTAIPASKAGAAHVGMAPEPVITVAKPKAVRAPRRATTSKATASKATTSKATASKATASKATTSKATTSKATPNAKPTAVAATADQPVSKLLGQMRGLGGKLLATTRQIEKLVST